MKKITATAIGSIMGLSLLMAGCSKTTSVEDYERVPMSASWAYGYSSIEEMTQSSDIVAIIKVTDSECKSENGTLYTTYTAQVEQLICGNDEKEIKVYMTGGIDESEKLIYEFDDDPLMQTGDEFLIFARKNQSGTYTILTGPEGRYVVKDDCVYPLNDETVTVKSAKERSKISADGENIEDFAELVKSYST
ncbi:MAG: hypothetical protein K2N06_11340 [Oscillospiraceae bacterium]|nr:hypothetical protein [Oscillospiraceae bacterium]